MMTNQNPTLPTPTEARALLREERTRLTRRVCELKRTVREAVAELDRLERRLAEVEDGERLLAEPQPFDRE